MVALGMTKWWACENCKAIFDDDDIIVDFVRNNDYGSLDCGEKTMRLRCPECGDVSYELLNGEWDGSVVEADICDICGEPEVPSEMNGWSICRDCRDIHYPKIKKWIGKYADEQKLTEDKVITLLCSYTEDN